MQNYYRDAGSFLRERLGGKAAKICIDGGFTCPNRDGTVATGGCLFCGERGAGDFTEEGMCIEKQVEARLARPLGARRADRFIAYFQAFSATHAPLAVLEKRYRAALRDARVVALAVATRPDCITPDTADLLASFAKERYVFVELGLQTASDDTARRMNIACSHAAFSRAAALLAERGIDVVVHLMVGLPGEGQKEAEDTMRFINRHPVSGVKIHSLYVMEGTPLADLFLAGEYRPLTMTEYVEAVTSLIAIARPDLVIHRLTGDCPRDRLLAPLWSAEKRAVLDCIHATLAARGITQGCRYPG